MTTHTPSSAGAAPFTSADQALDAYWLGFMRLLAQQLKEIEVVKATFDYSLFAGKTGALSGASFARTAR